MGAIVPIEVKSGSRTVSKCFQNYMQKCDAPYGIRISEKNFGFENNVLSIPLYAVLCIERGTLDGQ